MCHIKLMALHLRDQYMIQYKSTIFLNLTIVVVCRHRSKHCERIPYAWKLLLMLGTMRFSTTATILVFLCILTRLSVTLFKSFRKELLRLIAVPLTVLIINKVTMSVTIVLSEILIMLMMLMSYAQDLSNNKNVKMI